MEIKYFWGKQSVNKMTPTQKLFVEFALKISLYGFFWMQCGDLESASLGIHILLHPLCGCVLSRSVVFDSLRPYKL